MNKDELVRGNLRLLILSVVRERGSTYGYEIQQELKKLSDGELDITYGSLYPALHKLKAEGLISTREDTSGSRKRIFYSLTEAGERVLSSWKEEWIRFSRFMTRVLDINPTMLAS